jgi:hypothetical protein
MADIRFRLTGGDVTSVQSFQVESIALSLFFGGA